MLVDDLLSDLRKAGFYAQGYADDIIIMVGGRFEGVVSERIQYNRANGLKSWTNGFPTSALIKLVDNRKVQILEDDLNQ
ncbi:hypothetical protein Trydic_g17904 [Trypoxylus dichotomus]